MKPVQTKNSNLVYFSDDADIADLHCQRIRVGHIRSVWTFTKEERAHIAAGGNIAIEIFNEPVPPMRVETTGEEGWAEDNPYFAERIAELKRQFESSTESERRDRE